MNKNDIKMLLIVSACILVLLTFQLFKKNATYAYVYHGSELVLKVDLGINKSYIVIGDNGEVKISVNNHRIKVDNETSTYHLCSKQGYISKKGESIICLPNRIIIELPNEDIDTEVY